MCFIVLGSFAQGQTSVISSANVSSETTPEKTVTHTSGMWLGYYTKFRLRHKLFYYGEYHMRRREFVSYINKIYLRFGLTYLISKKVDVTLGIATPINFSEDPNDANTDYAVMEFRFWEQLLFVVPLLRAKTYHQIRFEQRWKRKFYKGAEYIQNYRWRYKFAIYVPLNHSHLQPKTVFFSFYDEIFIQTGRGITYNHFEDNRMFIGLGYIPGNHINIQTGYLWNYHHDGSPFDYEIEDIWRVAIYHDVDFYSKKQNKLKNQEHIR